MNEARIYLEKGRCFWCGRWSAGKALDPFAREHLIPVWACKSFPELRTEHGTIEGPGRVVKACPRCNTWKGGMPAEQYFHLRGDHKHKERRQALNFWRQVRAGIVLGQPMAPELRAAIISAMLKPIPGYNPDTTQWTSPPRFARIKNPPLKRLYYPTPDAIKAWEELNPDIHDRPIQQAGRRK